MESKELRIGNWVYNETTRENIEVYPMMIPQLNRLDGTNHNIKPIPLTEELLLKCGFVKTGVLTLSFENFLFEICLDGDDFVKQQYTLRINVCFVIKVKYLNQLQNLYFALTGQELEIKF